MTHKNFIGAKALWDRHMEHHWTEWIIRMNDPNTFSETTRIRLMQGQLDIGSLASILEIPRIQTKNCLLEKNLTLKILSKIKEYGIAIDPNTHTESWHLEGAGREETQTREVLVKRKYNGSFESMNRAKIWYTSQLLSNNGEYMITWKQLKSLRNLSKKGSKAQKK